MGDWETTKTTTTYNEAAHACFEIEEITDGYVVIRDGWAGQPHVRRVDQDGNYVVKKLHDYIKGKRLFVIGYNGMTDELVHDNKGKFLWFEVIMKVPKYD